MFGVGLGLRVCYASGYFYLVFIAVWIVFVYVFVSVGF